MYKGTIFMIALCAKTVWADIVQDISPTLSKVDEDWWKHGVFYQIYPRSYKDFDNDGDGDLKGIMEKLPHLKNAGITGVWLSPIMKSPQVDSGYDISDYRNIDPIYGTLDDFIQLINETHKLGIKIIMDFVPNHTSDQHKWFIDSENGIEPYKDYYLWAGDDPKNPPSNWKSIFRFSAWTWSEKRKQWFMHQFAPQQPDLNFRNPKVQEELKDVLKFYMDLGIDGFRIDAVPFLFEDKDLKDEPRSFNPNATEDDDWYLVHIYTQHLPETYDIIYAWREYLDEYSKQKGDFARILMTEVYGDMNETLLYYGTADGSKLGAHFTFNFNFITSINQWSSSAKDVQVAVSKWLDNIPQIYTSNWVLGNHDNRRVTSRLGTDNVDGFNMLMALLPGIGVTYNGEEIGQEDGEVTFEEGKDPAARNETTFQDKSRDFERTPFQWDSSVNAGYNQGAKPWLPVSKKYHETNLAAQQLDEQSHFQIYQKVLKKRQEEPTSLGSTWFEAVTEDVVVLKRTYSNKTIALVFKLGWDKGKSPTEIIGIPNVTCSEGKVSLTSFNSSYTTGSKINLEKIQLKAHECIVIDTVC